MIELLRNCLHGSEIATYVVSDNAFEKKIVKVATTQSGIADLQCELNGWQWYEKRRYNRINNLCKIIQKKESYLKIQIEYINGVTPDYRKGLESNAEILKNIIDHYCSIWPPSSDGHVPMHGDLSLDNIIYNSDGIHIIDWEHFSLNGVPCGFDAVYVLFETLFFSIKDRKMPNRKEIKIINELIEILRINNRLDRQLSQYPLKFIRDFIITNKAIWGKQIDVFPMKFPLIKFSDKQVSFIDRLVVGL